MNMDFSVTENTCHKVSEKFRSALSCKSLPGAFIKYIFKSMLILAICMIIIFKDSRADSDSLRVGVILPLSGAAASVGKSVGNGIKLALNELDPLTAAKIKLLYEDDALDPKKTVSAYHKLRQSNIEALITVSSGCSNAIASLADKDQIPTIALATDPAVVRNRNWIVNLYTSDTAEAVLAFKEAKKRGYRKIARVIALQDFMLAVKSEFDKANNGLISFPVDEEITIQEKDFRTIIAKIRARSDLDAVLLGVFPGQLGLLSKQLRAAGITLPFFGFETLEDANEVKVSEGSLHGSWYVNSDDPNQDFMNRYSRAYPGESMYGAANGYDAIALLAQAARKELNKEGLNQMLHELRDFEGALGKYSATGDNRFTLPAAVKVINQNGFEIIAR